MTTDGARINDRDRPLVEQMKLRARGELSPSIDTRWLLIEGATLIEQQVNEIDRRRSKLADQRSMLAEQGQRLDAVGSYATMLTDTMATNSVSALVGAHLRGLLGGETPQPVIRSVVVGGPLWEAVERYIDEPVQASGWNQRFREAMDAEVALVEQGPGVAAPEALARIAELEAQLAEAETERKAEAGHVDRLRSQRETMLDEWRQTTERAAEVVRRHDKLRAAIRATASELLGFDDSHETGERLMGLLQADYPNGEEPELGDEPAIVDGTVFVASQQTLGTSTIGLFATELDALRWAASMPRQMVVTEREVMGPL